MITHVCIKPFEYVFDSISSWHNPVVLETTFNPNHMFSLELHEENGVRIDAVGECPCQTSQDLPLNKLGSAGNSCLRWLEGSMLCGKMHHSVGEASEVKAEVTHLTCQTIKSFGAIQKLGMPGHFGMIFWFCTNHTIYHEVVGLWWYLNLSQSGKTLPHVLSHSPSHINPPNTYKEAQRSG